MKKPFLLPFAGLGGAILAALLCLQPAPAAQAPVRQPITALSAQRYMADVTWLSRPEMKGRASGSPELEQAADYIAAAFRQAGLRPAGDNGTFFQSFEVTTGAGPGPRNQL